MDARDKKSSGALVTSDALIQKIKEIIAIQKNTHQMYGDKIEKITKDICKQHVMANEKIDRISLLSAVMPSAVDQIKIDVQACEEIIASIKDNISLYTKNHNLNDLKLILWELHGFITENKVFYPIVQFTINVKRKRISSIPFISYRCH